MILIYLFHPWPVGQRATTEQTGDRDLGGCHPTFISPLKGQSRATAGEKNTTEGYRDLRHFLTGPRMGE